MPWKCYFFFFLLQLSYLFSDFRRNVYPLLPLQPFLVFHTSLVRSEPAGQTRKVVFVGVLAPNFIFCHVSVLGIELHIFWNEALLYNTHLNPELKLLEFLLFCTSVARIIICLTLQVPKI